MQKITINSFCSLNENGELINHPAKTIINVKEIYKGEDFRDMLVNKFKFDTSRFVILCDGALLNISTKITFGTLCKLLEKHTVLVGSQ